MPREDEENSKISFDVKIGKEIDAALGDVIRGLLMHPSAAVGDLIADGIGILGDRVKLKRELNAKMGMIEVRNRLDSSGVDMKDITPPKEEELHLLMNGMSLADDESVRSMWAGLFAKALEPSSESTAERPYISILESLSPLDAKIIDLLAFIERTEIELKTKTKQFIPKDIKSITPEEMEQANHIREDNHELQKQAVSSILQKSEDYGLAETGPPNWANNLMRQGVVERTRLHHTNSLSAISPRLSNERDLAKAISELHKHLRKIQESSIRQTSSPDRFFSQHSLGSLPNLEIQLTAFGKRFAAACGIL